MDKQKRDSIFHEIVKRARRVVIKVGSGVLTTEKGVRPLVFKKIAAETAKLKKKGISVVIVSSGAIACGMDLLKISRRPHKISEKQAVAAMGQPLLMQYYSQAFRKTGQNTAQILLTREDLKNRHRFLTAKHAFMELFRYGTVPIVNENDSVAVEEIKVGDNDQISAMVAHLVSADMLVILTDTDGFYNKDPKKFGDTVRIPLVEEVDEKTLGLASDTQNQKSTGGMITKLIAAKQAAVYGIPTWVVCGRNPGVLSDIFSGSDVGTLFLPKKSALPDRKYWIAYSIKPCGEIVIDEGAVTALKNGKKSLLPSGILEIRGNFNMGDAVSVVGRDNKPVARGLVIYGSRELLQIKGAKSSEIEKILGYKYDDEAINRDDLVILE